MITLRIRALEEELRTVEDRLAIAARRSAPFPAVVATLQARAEQLRAELAQARRARFRSDPS